MATTSAKAILNELTNQFPARTNQINKLYSMYGHQNEPYIDNVFIYGGPSTGKTAIVNTFLHKFNIKHATINLIECYTAKILFESILNQLNEYSCYCVSDVITRCDNLMDFIDVFKQFKSDLDRVVIVIDCAEELRSMDANLLPSFLRLNELVGDGIDVSVIYLSDIVYEKFYLKSRTALLPIKLYFPQYKRNELLDILMLDIEYNRSAIKSCYKSDKYFGEEFFENYLNVFLSVFYRACRDYSELRYMSRINFIKYYQPVASKQCSIDDSLGLWRNIAPVLKSSLEVLYLRTSASQRETTPTLELPFYAKYLLIAAYLASYNSAKDDKRLFMKYHGKRRKTMQQIKAKSKVSEQLNTQLGPQVFTIDRLLAIFYSILHDKVGFNNHLLVQVSSLVELQLLSMMSDACSLDARKYKCNVSFDCILGVAKVVGFNVRKYLSDFSHI